MAKKSDIHTGSLVWFQFPDGAYTSGVVVSTGRTRAKVSPGGKAKPWNVPYKDLSTSTPLVPVKIPEVVEFLVGQCVMFGRQTKDTPGLILEIQGNQIKLCVLWSCNGFASNATLWVPQALCRLTTPTDNPFSWVDP